jgi:hypothetical protein
MATKELPQDLTDRIAREENEADRAAMRKYVVEPVKTAGKKIYENVMGTSEQNETAQKNLDKQATEGSKLAKFLGGKTKKDEGFEPRMTSHGDVDFVDTSAVRSPVSGTGQDVRSPNMGVKSKSPKAMKKGGMVKSSASKRADGCCIRGKTRA